MKKIAVTALALILLGTAAYRAVGVLKTTANAYLFGYPIVLMEQTRLEMLGEKGLETNRFSHANSMPGPESRTVVRPNNDTLYSLAWLDLREGPQMVSVPDMGDRYYVVPFYDAWTNVFATVGTRATGNNAGSYVLVGPAWQGDLPEGIEVIQSPTDMVWTIVRIQINGASDIPAIRVLQQGFSIDPLPAWERGERSEAGTYTSENKSQAQTLSVLEVVDAMDARSFFSLLNRLMGEQAPAAADAPVLADIAALGIVPGEEFAPGAFTEWLMNQALTMVRDKLASIESQSRADATGWAVARENIGVYGTEYEVRAFVALIGLGALPPEEAMYPNADRDGQGELLNGSNHYRLHFEADDIPPVDAFWSLTMYDELGFLVDNSANRYLLGDRDDLHFNSDGSLDIYLQHTAPSDAGQNWLPAPAGRFAVTLRLYLPGEAAQDGTWNPPAIERLD